MAVFTCDQAGDNNTLLVILILIITCVTKLVGFNFHYHVKYNSEVKISTSAYMENNAMHRMHLPTLSNTNTGSTIMNYIMHNTEPRTNSSEVISRQMVPR